MAKRVAGAETPLAGPLDFSVVALQVATLPAPDRAALVDFQRQSARLQRAALGAQRAADDVAKRLDLVKQALLDTPAAPSKLRDDADAIAAQLRPILIALRGDRALRARNDNTPTAIVERAQSIVDDGWASTSAPTQIQKEAYVIASEQLTEQLAALRRLIDGDLRTLESAMEAAGAPWTPGRLPDWQP
jgi:hypothetical protein